jgi:hypothetical protein
MTQKLSEKSHRAAKSPSFVSPVVRLCDLVGPAVNYSFICFVMVIMTATIVSEPVWVWINNDEEEDTVRFRQRLSFTLFWFISIGLIHVRNSFVRSKNV